MRVGHHKLEELGEKLVDVDQRVVWLCSFSQTERERERDSIRCLVVCVYLNTCAARACALLGVCMSCLDVCVEVRVGVRVYGLFGEVFGGLVGGRRRRSGSRVGTRGGSWSRRWRWTPAAAALAMEHSLWWVMSISKT